jgi:lipoprotein-anchoring transpeptidase ErfK/SrfK
MSVYSVIIRFCLISALICAVAESSLAQAIRTPAPPRTMMGTRAAQQPRPVQQQPRPVQQPMRKPAELIRKQDPITINQALLAKVSPDDTHVIVSLAKQRVYLMTGEQVIIDSPISSGKRGHESPHGSFSVMEKDKDHHSSLYGDFVDSKGRTVRAGVSARIDSAPSGTHFTGAAMKWFMRLTGEGVGMHVGILPGYPASHGCIRMPSQTAELFYGRVKVGTPVEVQPP